MKAFFLVVLLIVAKSHVWGIANFAEVYPPSVQMLQNTTQFVGDRHGDFVGDSVAILSDGSCWKVHPTSQGIYRFWQPGETVRIKVRTDWYWFKREHKFALYNYDRDESIKVMLVEHCAEPLQIVDTKSYAKSQRAVYNPHTVYYQNSNGTQSSYTTYHFSHYAPMDFRKILALSDGSVWVIRKNLGEFEVGMKVYIGAQGVPDRFYDFVFIVGDEREAKWTYARPQK